MSNIRLSTAVRNARLDQITVFASSSATLSLYTGTQPAGGAAITTQTLLAQLICGATFAASAVSGVLTLNTIAQDSVADATGVATWARLDTSSGTWVADFDVSTTGAGTGDIQLASTSISTGGVVSLSGPNTLTDANAA